MTTAKALVIGASGHVGSALLRALKRSGGFDAVGTYMSRSVNGCLRLDVRDEPAVRSCFAATAPSVAFLAVNNRGGVDSAEGDPAEATVLHVLGTRHVAEAAARCGARLVYYSTDYVFDGEAGPYAEEDEPHPLNAYGRAKWEAETSIAAISSSYLILRTTAVFGWDRRSRNFAMQLWERLHAGHTLRVPADQWCNPTLVDYLAEVSVQLVQMGLHGVFNVVGRDRVSRSELATSLARAMALDPALVVPVPTAMLGQEAPRPLHGGLKTEKLEATLGTVPLDLTESLTCFRRQMDIRQACDDLVAGLPTEAEGVSRSSRPA